MVFQRHFSDTNLTASLAVLGFLISKYGKRCSQTLSLNDKQKKPQCRKYWGLVPVLIEQEKVLLLVFTLNRFFDLFGLRTIDQLNVGHGCFVARTETTL